MPSETIIYGFIEGTGFVPQPMRKLFRKHNKQVLAHLPEHDEYPFLSRSMFSYPRYEQSQGTFVTQIIHFGGSMNRLEYEAVPIWVDKLERLLARLYWIEATAHIWTDYVNGCYQFWWMADQTIADTYRSGQPSTTDRWVRKDLHLRRHLDGPPSEPFPQ